MKELIRVSGLLLLCAAAAFGWCAHAVMSNETDRKLEKIREKLDKVMLQYKKVHEVPGFSIGILKDHKVIYAGGFGVRNLDTGEPVTTRSLFHMASVSKPFAAAAVMQLVEDGKLKLEDRLVKYLPYFKIDDKRYKDITIGQMLSHTSGLPDVRDYEWDKPQYDDGAAERYIRSLAKEKMIADPGKIFSYSNMAYDILADVIAGASGMTFEAYIKKHIFKPLGMKDSTFLKKEVPQELANKAHVISPALDFRVVVSKVYPYNRAHAPSSTLHSNVEDMFRWAKANLNGGVLKGRRILKPAGHQLMWTPQVKGIRGNEHRAVGLSWFIDHYKGHKTVSHGGGDVGFRTYFLLVPGKSIAVVTMGNSDTFPSDNVAFAALDILLGEEPEKPRQWIVVPVSRMMAKKGVKAAVELYHRLKKEAFDDYLFREVFLDRLGYALMRENRFNDAVEIFKLNVSEYPESWNVYDSLGEAYLKKGDKAMAIKNYQKAVELNPRESGRERRNYANQVEILRKLREDKQD